MWQFNRYLKFILFSLIFFCCACSNNVGDPQVVEFERLAKEGDYELACDLGRKILHKNPEDGRIAYIMSDVFLNWEKEDSSLVYLNKAIEYGPDWDALYNNRGLILQNRDDHEGAIADFNKALEHDSTAPYAYNNRGYSKILLGRFREGMKDVLKSEELDDDNAYVYRNKALFYEKTAKYSSACKWLQKAYGKKFYDQIENQIEFIKMRVCK